MAEPTLTLGLQNLRNQVNRTFTKRKRASDGWIGDDAHRKRPSGHNPDDTPDSKPTWDGDADSKPEVRAWDMDADLREEGVTAQQYVDHLCRLPGLSSVIRFIIYNRKIYTAENDFFPETYTGDNPHTGHVHHEGARTQLADSNTTFNYRLEELVMPTAEEIAAAVWAHKPDSKQSAGGYLVTEGARSKELRENFLPAIQAALAEVPTASENAEAVVAALGGVALTDLADVIRATLGAERTAELKELL
jgi:hypothetical protein